MLLLASADNSLLELALPSLSGSNSVVESRLPKPLVAGSIPVSRSNPFPRKFRIQ
jgi:hypothetical protein